MNGDYAYGCDNCEQMDGRAVLVWKEEQLPGKNRGHFALCYDCLRELYMEFIAKYDRQVESIIVKRAMIPESLRDAVYERDDYRCVQCGSTDDLTLDHVVPFSVGGQTTMENLRTLCRSCNSKKGARRQ